MPTCVADIESLLLLGLPQEVQRIDDPVAVGTFQGQRPAKLRAGHDGDVVEAAFAQLREREVASHSRVEVNRDTEFARAQRSPANTARGNRYSGTTPPTIPPAYACSSKTSTWQPPRASSMAADMPPGPAPMIATFRSDGPAAGAGSAAFPDLR